MDAESPPPKNSSANLSDLVKEMVKEMDANEFYSRNDLYDDSAEVISKIVFVILLFAGLTAAFHHTYESAAVNEGLLPPASRASTQCPKIGYESIVLCVCRSDRHLGSQFRLLVCCRKQNARTNRVSIYCLLTCVEALRTDETKHAQVDVAGQYSTVSPPV